MLANIVVASLHAPPTPQERYSSVPPSVAWPQQQGGAGIQGDEWDGGVVDGGGYSGRGWYGQRGTTIGRRRNGRRRAMLGRERLSAGRRSAGGGRARRWRSLPWRTAFLDYRQPSAGQQRTSARMAHPLQCALNVFRKVACSLCWGWSRAAYKTWQQYLDWG